MVLSVCLVGFGASASYFHLPCISTVDGLHVAAVLDPSHERRQLAASLGVPVTRSSEQLASTISALQPNIVVIATPSSEHAGQARVALQEGCHVVIEKPAAFDGRSFAELCELASRYKRVLLPFHNRQFDNDHLFLVKAVRAGAIGSLLRVDLTQNRNGHWNDYATPAFDPAWRKKRIWGGGVWNDWGPHLIDQLLRIVNLGPPAKHMTSMFSVADDAESMVTSQFEWASCVGRITISAHEDIGSMRCVAVGTDGVISVAGGDDCGSVKITTRSGTIVEPYINNPCLGAQIYEGLRDKLQGAQNKTGIWIKEAQEVYDLLGAGRAA